MKLSDLFTEQSIKIDVAPAAKEALLEAILRDLDSKDLVTEFDDVLRDVIDREKVMSTGIGNGVAIPHAYTNGVEHLVAGFYRTTAGVDFASLDGKEVDLFFIILGPKASRRNHIKVLAKISRLLNHEDFRTSLREATSVAEVLEVFKRYGDR